MTEYSPKPKGLSRLFGGFRSNTPKDRTRLSKKKSSINSSVDIIEELKHDASRVTRELQLREEEEYSKAIDSQTGERKDHTALLHSLVGNDSTESLVQRRQMAVWDGSPRLGGLLMAKLSPELWGQIASHLSLADAASLAFSCKVLRDRLGPETWHILNDAEHHHERIDFLVRQDELLPSHLLCAVCGTYHLRTQIGQETLKPNGILNPLFHCPNMSNQKFKAPRARITPGRSLPFTFVQLVTRADRYSPNHGISEETLARRWKDRDSGWSYQTRYILHNGHLLMRVISSAFVTPGLPPSGKRYLLYSARDDFTPYFSVCSHWRDGELMKLCKCALDHLPIPPKGLTEHVAHRLHRPNLIVNLCSDCQPMRRCPECPTEYLIEMKLVEDRSDPADLFKQAIVVTRWSDLGDGTTPWSPEWAACTGELPDFDSFTAIGRRAVSGIFEGHLNVDAIPPQRVLSLNPNNEKQGEKGHNWY